MPVVLVQAGSAVEVPEGPPPPSSDVVSAGVVEPVVTAVDTAAVLHRVDVTF